MKRFSILKKFSLTTFVIALMMVVIGYFILNYYKNNLENEVFKKVQHELANLTDLKLKEKFNVGISNAISIANDSSIKKALVTNDRQLAINALSNLSKKMKESTPFKNIKVHVHTKNTFSFVRSWKLKKFGDDLNSFRHSVVKVNNQKTAVNTFEIGKAGLSIRAVVPIFDSSHTHVGSLEFMQGVNSVAKSFEKSKDSFLLLMNKSLAVAKADDSKILKNYIISQKFVNKNFLNDSKKIDFSTLFNNKYLISDEYFYTYIDVKDFNNKKLGIALVGRPISKVTSAVDEASSIIWIALGLLVFSIFLVTIASLLNLKKSVLTPLSNLKESIFQTKNNISGDAKKIEVLSNDEVGDVVNSFNEYLESIESGVKQDKEVIEETRLVIEKVNNGLLNDRISKKANSQQVESLVHEINNMLSKMQENLTKLCEVLILMSSAKFDTKIPHIDGLTGTIASLFSGVKVTSSTINEIMCLIDISSQELTSSSNELSEASKRLSDSSNDQAASLEQTAAAIEEITATITKTTQTSQKMSTFAQNVSVSNEKGKTLAFRTSDSMEELSSEVEAINESITIIDQIAFQTNILSLNAAVEAATAGEAGKGFAVVAQEVRNLASRSAEAANEIKALVESATQKAKSGKTITSEMIEGYNELNENITTTIDLIKDVANASKEQQLAMAQITDTVNSLDQATQKNASLASSISDMAIKTENLATQLQNTIEQTSFDEKAKSLVCDSNMIININKLKADHISFKNTNFAECKTGNNFEVKSHHMCNLGKWIDLNEKEKIAESTEWTNLKDAHKNVHQLVQKTVELYSRNAENTEIFAITENIETNIDKVFILLDKIRENNCKDK